MLYREILTVCSQIHTKHINMLCGQNARFLMRTPSCWGMTWHYSLISPQCSRRMTLSRASATTFIPPTLPWLTHQLFLWLTHQSFHRPQTTHTISKYLIFCLPSHSSWTSEHLKIMAPCSVQTLAATHPVTECHIPGKQNPQPHQCEKLNTHKIFKVKTVGVYNYHWSVRTLCLQILCCSQLALWEQQWLCVPPLVSLNKTTEAQTTLPLLLLLPSPPEQKQDNKLTSE